MRAYISRSRAEAINGTIELEGEHGSGVSAYLEFDTIGLETEDTVSIEKETYFTHRRSIFEVSFTKQEKEIFNINCRRIEQPGSCRQNVHKTSHCRNASVYINPKA